MLVPYWYKGTFRWGTFGSLSGSAQSGTFGSLIEGLKNKKPKNPFKKLQKDFKKKVINPVQKKVKNVFKPKPKPKPKMKIPVPVPFASYADNVMPLDDNNIEKDIAEYQKALNGEKSSKMVSKNPLGSLYFQPTGTKCNAPDGKLVDRYIVVDSRADTDLFNSADADFNKSVAPFNILDYKSTLTNKCSSLTITPVDVYGRQQKKQTHYV
jgi:hypothetical protein